MSIPLMSLLVMGKEPVDKDTYPWESSKGQLIAYKQTFTLKAITIVVSIGINYIGIRMAFTESIMVILEAS
jgi:hypothetical protein